MAVTASDLSNHLSDLLTNVQDDNEGHSYSIIEVKSDSLIVQCTDDTDGMVNFFEVKPVITEL